MDRTGPLSAVAPLAESQGAFITSHILAVPRPPGSLVRWSIKAA